MTAGSVTLETEAGSLIERAVGGDEVAFARIVAAYHEDMARIAYLVCGDLDVAGDAVQAAWAIAWRRLGSLRDPDRLGPWLMAIAANEARQVARSSRRRRVRELAVETPATSTTADRAGLIDLANALGRLDPKDRSMIGLRYLAGFDSEEVGRALGMSASGVRARLSRIVARLRMELGDD